MFKILIKNAKIINEGKIFESDLLIKNDIIFKICKNIKADHDCKVIDAKGKILIPGVIDDQVHFREPGLTHKATINSESKAAIAGGITSYIEMPNTIPQTTTLLELNNKFKIAERNSHANYSFMFGGTNENIEEIKNIDSKKVAGLKLFLGSSTGNMLVDEESVLKNIFLNTDLLISVHSEDENIINENINKYKSKYGSNIPFELHPIIRSEKACLKSTKRIIKLAKETGARLHVFHLSTESESLLFENNIPLKDKKITSEVCVHHLWFSDEDYKEKQSYIKWNPAIKTKQDRHALWKALNNDRIDVVASDHAPHTIEEKSNSYLECPSGGPLVQHALVSMIEHHLNNKITLEKIVTKMCHNPADLFQISNRGFIREGYYADLVLIDLEKPWTVNKKNILYKCNWSPFEGVEFNSSISKTFVNGKLVYDEGIFDKKLHGKELTFNR
ncbi:dihydroorotase [Flavobacteriaceae bacterium]|jgi:dihydroorotase|nr:dihydroorotase [Flavobacteriaceae bacterium]|tara:strand:+ start:18660 stop:19997 length:1338 start_codon:yes stop_codon:yes gene_type:complete